MSDNEEGETIENVVSRQIKRKQQKKDRKKKLRQQEYQLQDQLQDKNVTIPMPISSIIKIETKLDDSIIKSRDPEACEICKTEKWIYYCEDCDVYYCENCMDKKHRELMNQNIQHTQIKERILIHPNSNTKNELKEKLNTFSNVVLDTSNQNNNLFNNDDLIITKQENQHKEVKQHEGLRCNKCFLLLCNDDDFIYGNGAIYTDPAVLKKHHFYNLYDKGKSVYCKNIHCIGRVELFSYGHQTHPMYRLLMNHITFEDNFLKNPKYKNNDIIKNKILGRNRPVMPSENSSVSGSCIDGW